MLINYRWMQYSTKQSANALQSRNIKHSYATRCFFIGLSCSRDFGVILWKCASASSSSVELNFSGRSWHQQEGSGNMAPSMLIPFGTHSTASGSTLVEGLTADFALKLPPYFSVTCLKAPSFVACQAFAAWNRKASWLSSKFSTSGNK